MESRESLLRQNGGLKLKTVNYADLTDADRAGIKFWGEYGAEELHFKSLDEAIESYLDGSDEGYPAVDAPYFGNINEAAVIQFDGFVEMKMHDSSADVEWVLEFLLERWDEDYGNMIDGTPTEQTDAMKTAAKEFIDKVREEYYVWACEPAIRIVVPVVAWVKQHAPHWLEDPVVLAGGKELPENA